MFFCYTINSQQYLMSFANVFGAQFVEQCLRLSDHLASITRDVIITSCNLARLWQSPSCIALALVALMLIALMIVPREKCDIL